EAAFRREMETRFVAAEADLDRAYTVFEAALPGRVAAALAPARANVRGLALELSSWQNSIHLAYALVSGGDAAARFLYAGFEKPLLLPVRRGDLEVGQMVRDYESELDRCDRRLCAEFALTSERHPAALPRDEAFRQWLVRLEPARDTAVKAGIESSLLLTGSVLDTIFIRQSAALLSRLFAAVSARLSLSAAAAGVGALADGPLPVGDAVGGVILIGGTVWSGIDFYRVRVELPVRLEAELNRSLDEYETMLKTEALTQVRTRTEQYRQAYRRLRRQLEER
ncbi:MAG: hypothetical protein AB7F32_12815, partial [Victivallaceae bacterium]